MERIIFNLFLPCCSLVQRILNNWQFAFMKYLEKYKWNVRIFHATIESRIYFPKTDPNYIYASPRTREEVEKLLFHEIKAHENFVFTSVKGDYGEAIYPFFQYAVLIDVPKDIRIQRVRNRSFQKFGNRMLTGGDLYEQQ